MANGSIVFTREGVIQFQQVRATRTDGSGSVTQDWTEREP